MPRTDIIRLNCDQFECTTTNDYTSLQEAQNAGWGEVSYCKIADVVSLSIRPMVLCPTHYGHLIYALHGDTQAPQA